MDEKYRAEYIQFLRIAQGSLKELETHLLLAARVELTTTQAVSPILKLANLSVDDTFSHPFSSR
jgi:four helix bundle protein